jgi:hypothetical protein
MGYASSFFEEEVDAREECPVMDDRLQFVARRLPDPGFVLR